MRKGVRAKEALATSHNAEKKGRTLLANRKGQGHLESLEKGEAATEFASRRRASGRYTGGEKVSAPKEQAREKRSPKGDPARGYRGGGKRARKKML